METGKGILYPSEHSEFADTATGARIHKLTAQPCINHATYFLQSSFSHDGETVLFISYRGGSAQLYSITPFPGGPIRQMTAGEGIHPFSPAFSRDGKEVFFIRSGSVWAIELEKLSERRIVSFDGSQLGECSLSASGQWLVAAIKKGAQSGLAVGRTDGTNWHVIPFPRTVIHPQFHPAEEDWIEFSGDPAPRMHRVRRDGSAMECLYEHGNDEFVVHETFLGTTGDLVYTVWPRELRRMNWNTREQSRIALFNAWHITPNRSGSKVLCDTNHPDRGIFIVDVTSGARQQVCLSQSSNEGSQWMKSSYALAADFEAARSAAKTEGTVSWMEVAKDTVYGPQWTHPHPSFSPDERRVVFASDRDGHPQVYVAEVPDEPAVMTLDNGLD
jgi:oligogalacturonide lyase